MLWKGAADLSEPFNTKTKTIGHLDREKQRKQGNTMTHGLCYFCDSEIMLFVNGNEKCLIIYFFMYRAIEMKSYLIEKKLYVICFKCLI